MPAVIRKVRWKPAEEAQQIYIDLDQAGRCNQFTLCGCHKELARLPVLLLNTVTDSPCKELTASPTGRCQ